MEVELPVVHVWYHSFAARLGNWVFRYFFFFYAQCRPPFRFPLAPENRIRTVAYTTCGTSHSGDSTVKRLLGLSLILMPPHSFSSLPEGPEDICTRGRINGKCSDIVLSIRFGAGKRHFLQVYSRGTAAKSTIRRILSSAACLIIIITCTLSCRRRRRSSSLLPPAARRLLSWLLLPLGSFGCHSSSTIHHSSFSLTHFPSVPSQAALYAVRWYFGQEEFYRYVPREAKPTFVFAVAGINVDVS